MGDLRAHKRAMRAMIVTSVVVVAVGLGACGGSSERAKLLAQVRAGLIRNAPGGFAPAAGVPFHVTGDLIDCIVSGARSLPIGQLRQLAAGHPSETVNVRVVVRCLSAGHDLSGVRAWLAGEATSGMPSYYPVALRTCLAAQLESLSAAQLRRLFTLAVGRSSAIEQAGATLAVRCMHQHPELVRAFLILAAGAAMHSTHAAPRRERCVIEQLRRLPIAVLEKALSDGPFPFNRAAVISIRDHVLAACGKVPARA